MTPVLVKETHVNRHRDEAENYGEREDKRHQHLPTIERVPFANQGQSLPEQTL